MKKQSFITILLLFFCATTAIAQETGNQIVTKIYKEQIIKNKQQISIEYQPNINKYHKKLITNP
ncbi:MAG: hypothetical protein FWC39_02595 [Bacteroidetes bacterium]|nr:hypothetical protein [Bacteroidota bacterium]